MLLIDTMSPGLNELIDIIKKQETILLLWKKWSQNYQFITWFIGKHCNHIDMMMISHWNETCVAVRYLPLLYSTFSGFMPNYIYIYSFLALYTCIVYFDKFINNWRCARDCRLQNSLSFLKYSQILLDCFTQTMCCTRFYCQHRPHGLLLKVFASMH